MILTLGYGMDKRANIKVTLVPQVQVSSNTPLGGHRTDQQRKSRRRINVVFARIPRAALTLLSISTRRARSTTSNICYGRCRMKLLKLIKMKMAGVYWSRRTAAILSGTRCGIYADRPQICRDHSN